MAILSQGLVMLIAGMGIVFSFLVVLVFVMALSAKIIPRFNHILPDPEPRKKATRQASSSSDAEIAVAIAVAVARSA